ncbi:MAG TPA: hypothetical protein VG605_16725 [Puia sp.]|nr:hypothetical protein [Puia sp.]
MLQKFEAVSGQSVYDVCLNCYGSLDLLYKLIQDNGLDSVNVSPHSRQVFIYDDALVIDQGVNQQFTQAGKKYATDIATVGGSFFKVCGRPPLVKVPLPFNDTTNQTEDMFSDVNSTSYTSNQDGVVLITPIDKDGNSMAGYDIVQIEREIMPLFASQWSWNKAQGILTLLNGTTLDAGMSLYIIYKKLVTA